MLEQSTIDRTAACSVAWMLREELSRRILDDPAVELRYLAGDDSVVEEALLEACFRADVRTHDYHRALEIDGGLMQLHQWSVAEVFLGTADPGPYDRISRESPTGTGENAHLNGWMVRGNSP